jgi:hypothetical protein
MAIIISGPAAKNPAEITGRMRATSPMTIGSETKAASDRFREDRHADLERQAVAEGRDDRCPKARVAAVERPAP